MKHLLDTAAPLGLTGTNLGDSRPRRQTIVAAAGICLALLAIALTVMHFGSNQGMAFPGFIPFAATNWAIADILTAILLLAQYHASKRIFLAILAFGYGASGLLSWPYLLAFPGVLSTGPVAVSDQQIPAYSWVTWHLLFSGSILIATFIERDRKQNGTSRGAPSLWIVITSTIATTGLITLAIFAFKNHLPVLVLNGHFLQPVWSTVIIPPLLAMTLAALGLIAADWRRLTNLNLWLFVAVSADGLDLLLNMFSTRRFSYNWYLGKLETVLASAIVLFMLIYDVTSMYRKLADIATLDPLTNLNNRRSFDNHMEFILSLLHRNPSNLAMLVIDIDHFKNFNDTFGHAAGDIILAQVAASLNSVAVRPLDMVARWGGEEFVVILPDAKEREDALTVADRARRFVEGIKYLSPDGKVAKVTVSIGIAYASSNDFPNSMDLFKTADKSLYEAKASGRNQIVLADCKSAETETPRTPVIQARIAADTRSAKAGPPPA